MQTTSRYGRSLIDRHLVELEGDVQIHSRKGYLFQMDRLNYDGTDHELYTDDPVQMKGPDVDHPTMFLKGIGLHGQIDEEHFVLHKNVSAQRKLSKGTSWLRIYSAAGEFFTDDQRSRFTGGVRSYLPDMELQSDLQELTVAKQQESMSAKGNVVLKSRDRIGRADSAFIEIGGNKIILEGRARVESKNNHVTGRRMVLYTDDDRIEVEQAQGKVAN